jgi:hypothetical protein
MVGVMRQGIENYGDFGDAPEVSMPTQIPVRAVRSTVPSAIDVLMLSLLAATINAIIVLIILWAYS